MTAILTPAILGLTGFFALMSLSSSGISTFSVVALTTAYGTPLSVANLALTAYLAAQALGVLGGGFIADLTRRHADVAALGYAINAGIVAMIGLVALGTAPLLVAMAAAGLLGGLIMPSRDMLVRAAAPPGAVGRTFGVVTTGFNFAGMLGPLMFGYIMDQGAPRWVFLISMIFMTITALDRVARRPPCRRQAPRARRGGGGGVGRMSRGLAVVARQVHAAAKSERSVAMIRAADVPQDGLVAVVKRDCPTCVMTAPVLGELARRGGLTVYTQDDPGFPETVPSREADLGLDVSHRLKIEIVPTLIRMEGGREVGAHLRLGPRRMGAADRHRRSRA